MSSFANIGICHRSFTTLNVSVRQHSYDLWAEPNISAKWKFMSYYQYLIERECPEGQLVAPANRRAEARRHPTDVSASSVIARRSVHSDRRPVTTVPARFSCSGWLRKTLNLVHFAFEGASSQPPLRRTRT